VAQCERTDDHIDGDVRKRQLAQLGFVELALGNLLAGEGEHLRRCVGTDDFVAERRQVRGVAASTAGSVESHPHGEAVEDFAHDRLLEVE